jgi:outer membrane protein assembly factor BamB
VALTRVDGSKLWQFETGSVTKAPPIIVGEFVIVATMTGQLFSLRLTDGQKVAQLNLGEPIVQSPISDGNRVIIADEDGHIYCFGTLSASIK